MTRARRLTGEERRLWAAVTRGVVPLDGRTPPADEPDPRGPASPLPARSAEASTKTLAKTLAKTSAAKTPTKTLAAKVLPPELPPPKPLAPLERRARSALRRGSVQPDAVLDLHGLRQAEAHGTLLAFLARARAAGHGLVLVVTGKGERDFGARDFTGRDDPLAERGVLRRSVPHWLAAPGLRTLVLGFEEAASRRGGAGALYVRLRRRG